MIRKATAQSETKQPAASPCAWSVATKAEVCCAEVRAKLTLPEPSEPLVEVDIGDRVWHRNHAKQFPCLSSMLSFHMLKVTVRPLLCSKIHS